jgi:hypothetical protein
VPTTSSCGRGRRGPRRKAAGNDPALGLVWRQFFDPESLGAAQRLLDAAQARLRAAIDDLHAIQEAAERLLDEHTEAAEQVAERLEQARDLAPDQPRGGLGGVVDDVRDSVGGAVDDVRGFVEDNANRIEAASGIVSDLSSLMGTVADLEIPVVSQALGGMSIGFDAVALGGLAVADLGGASVSGEQYLQQAISLGGGVVGELPGIPGTGVEHIAGELANVGSGAYTPRDGRQEAQLLASAHPLLSVLRPYLATENTIRDMDDWGADMRAAEEADRAAREERSSW